MSTLPSPVKSPVVHAHAGLAVVGQHDGQVVDVHFAVQIGVAGQDRFDAPAGTVELHVIPTAG